MVSKDGIVDPVLSLCVSSKFMSPEDVTQVSTSIMCHIL